MAQCLKPFVVRNKYANTFTRTNRAETSHAVPCGKCPQCSKRKISGWSFRLMEEEKISSSAYFVTLTYDTLHIPVSKNGQMEISRRDLQLFFKRLRKCHHDYAKKSRTKEPKIKYYAVGEYGGRFKRPHYHVILFNAQLELIQPNWQLGNVHYGQVTGASVGYSLKYMSKPWKKTHQRDDRQKPFALMSKALGISYLEKMWLWHLDDIDNRMYLNLLGGIKIAMPRYYKDKIYSPMERKRLAYLGRQLFNQEEQKQMKKQGDKYYINQANGAIALIRKQAYEAAKDYV